MQTRNRMLMTVLSIVAAGSVVVWWSARQTSLPARAGASATPAASPAQAAQHAAAEAAAKPAANRKFKILHIMSYDSSWTEWTMGQFEAFKEPLADLDVEYKVFEMDVKRNTTPEWKAKVTAEAKQLIDTWQPDLVYTTDDFVQSAVVKDYLDRPLPFVFSGVNADPSVYGFTGSRNVTGVLEREHIVQTANLLKSILPSVQRIAVLSDRGETWPAVIQRIRQSESQMGLEIVSVDVVDTYEQYQQTARSYVGRVDAIMTLGVYSLKDPQGQSVPIETVMRWTYEQIPLPNVSFWTNRVPQGLLCAVAISSYAQGHRAGEIARQILVNGKRPGDFAIEPTIRGTPIVNLAAARKLGIKIPSTVLLTAKVVNKNEWE